MADQRTAAVLRAAGYDEETLTAVLGHPADRVIPAPHTPYYLARVDDPRLRTLIALFTLDVPVAGEQAEAAGFGPGHPWLVSQGDGKVRSRYRVMPFRSVVVAWDWESRGLTRDYVTGINGTARLLSDLTVRRPARRAADVGCASGIQALMAASHADEVIATDVNERALELTRLNCALNGVANVETRAGDLFEPLRGETFDLLVCNPPFVIAPGDDRIYRRDPRAGDGFCAELVRGAPEHLAPDGTACLLLGWIERDGESWWERPASWLPEGCHALLLHVESLEPLDYAARWMGLGDDPGANAAELARWTAHLRDLGAARLGYGALVMRKTAATPRRAVHELHAAPATDAGEQIARILDAMDAGPERLASGRPAVAEHRVVRTTTRDGGPPRSVAEVEALHGLRLRRALDERDLSLLQALDGRTSIEEIARLLARRSGWDASKTQAWATRSAWELAMLGLLAP